MATPRQRVLYRTSRVGRLSLSLRKALLVTTLALSNPRIAPAEKNIFVSLPGKRVFQDYLSSPVPNSLSTNNIDVLHFDAHDRLYSLTQHHDLIYFSVTLNQPLSFQEQKVEIMSYGGGYGGGRGGGGGYNNGYDNHRSRDNYSSRYSNGYEKPTV